MSTDLPSGSWPWLHDAARWVGGWIYIPRLRLRVRGSEHVPAEGPVVVVANHSTMLEGPILFGVLPRRLVFLVKNEMFLGPLGWGLCRLGQIPVRRGEPHRGALATATRVLNAGGVVGVFPEGTRGSGAVEHAHGGAAWLARATGAMVLPVACRGTTWGAGTRNRCSRRVVDIVIGAPFSLPAERGRAALAASTGRLRTELAALVDELDRRRAGGPEEDV
ncbi:MAG: 1-acyl-sn-glycerol-3-phosphate acyltransferase [Kutzneria sp.]|nr:1-acyl-sn-glycerol-3-phosphate acyltransferase [Kutzneria sp.]MBV9843644.1 1-acyl-sn-glycerol-3-phosphate acyltransferase [Kutzneria sp.]